MNTNSRYLSALPGFSWPAISGQSAAQKLALLFQIEQAQWRRPEQILASQFEQLRQVVPFAAAHVPHYRKQLGGRCAPHDITPDTWHAIPILTRKFLHDAGAELRSEHIPPEHGRTFKISTSGSTGMVVELLGTALTNLFWQVFCLRDHLWHGRNLSEKLCAIRYLRDPALKGAMGMQATGWGPATDDIAHTGPSVSYDILLDVGHLAERLVEDRPGYLLSHPSLISGLARFHLDRGVVPIGLKQVRTMGETMDDSLRELCRKAWNVPVVDIYSCQEAGYLALQCPEHQHYHVQSENVLLEVVDAAGNPCQPGEVGRVLITSLNNYATPMIRYEIGDYAEVGEPCACGRGLPVLKRILGRYRNLLTLPDGSLRWPRLGYESRLQEVAPIELMQMVQRGLEDIVVRLVMPRPLVAEERENLIAFIHSMLGHPFILHFEYTDDIRNQANGKIEQFISRIEAGQYHSRSP